MRVIITGATSFVGAAVVAELLKRGHEVIAVLRPGSKKSERITGENQQALQEGRLLLVENDLSRPAELEGKVRLALEGWRGSGAAASGASPLADAFCHLGWGGSGSDSRTDGALQERNLLDALETMKAAKAMGCERFLFTGSQAEYGLHDSLMTEETVCAPRSLYGQSKLAMGKRGEALAKEIGIQYLHVRIFSAYGPGDHPWTLVESCLDAFLKDEGISLGACSQQWNFIYIKDLAKGICSLLETPKERFSGLTNPVFNLAGGETKVLREFVEELHGLCGGRGVCRYNTRPENAEGLINLIPSIEKMKAVTGWVPETDFKEGIRRTVESRKSLTY